MSRSRILAIVTAAVVAFAIVALALPAFDSVAQSGYGASFTVDGTPANGGTDIPASRQPVFGGEGTPGSTVTLRIEPGAITFTATVGSDGKFSVTSPQALNPGSYQVYLNDELVAGIKVQAPAPPATGSGILDDAGGTSTLLLAGLAGLVVAAGAAFFTRQRAQ